MKYIFQFLSNAVQRFQGSTCVQFLLRSEPEKLRHDLKTSHQSDVEIVLMGIIRAMGANFGIDAVGSLFDDSSLLFSHPNRKLSSKYMYVNRASFHTC